jgi:hypothetical protein
MDYVFRQRAQQSEQAETVKAECVGVGWRKTGVHGKPAVESGTCWTMVPFHSCF